VRTWGWVLAILGWAAMAAAGFGGLFLAYLGGDASRVVLGSWGSKLCVLADHRAAFLAATGVLLLVLAALALASPVGYWRSRRQLFFPGERGMIMVDTSTVEECLRRELSEEPDVVRSRVAVRPVRGALLCQLTVWLEAGGDVVERVHSLQERLQSYYAFVLPGGAPLKVEAATRLIYRKGSPRPISGRQPARGGSGREAGAGDPYGGPRYPVDGGDADASGMTSS